MRIGLGMSIVGGGYAPVPPPSFSPLSLFANGEEGAWYDPSDLSSLAQNSDGTGAVSVGDPVGYMADKSGNGNHAIQSTLTARPTLQQSGGLYYLDFDGVDDVLLMGDVFDAQIAGVGGKVQVTAGVTYDADSALLVKNGDSSQSESQRQYGLLRRSSGNSASLASYALLSTDYTFVTGSSITASQQYIQTVSYDQSQGTSGTTANTTVRHNHRLDGVEETLTALLSSGNLGEIQDATAQLAIGGQYGTSGPLSGAFNGRLYGLIINAGNIYTGETLANIESYMAGKTGVTL